MSSPHEILWAYFFEDDMKLLFKISFAIISLLINIFPASAQIDNRRIGRTFLNERIIVKFKGELNQEVEDDVFASHRVKKHKFIKDFKTYVVLTNSTAETLTTIEKLKKRKDVEFAEPDMYCEPVGKIDVPNDANLSNQWWITNINLPAAWDINKGSSNTIIAIIDSGCDTTHPDLIDKYVTGYNFFDNNTNTQDIRGHGTAVAGCAAASTNNGIGGAGSGRDCKIMPLRVSDANGYAYWSTIAQAMQWAADRGVKVANASFACGESTTIQSAARYMNSKGAVFCCSAGNQATQLTGINTPEVIIVGATDSVDNLASFSNWGSSVDLVAPGVNCYTTNLGGGYQWWSGTSFSSPITAGLVGLLFSTNPLLKPSDIDNILKNTAKDLGDPGQDLKYAFGRIDASKAVQSALSTIISIPPSPLPGPDIIAPSVAITAPNNGQLIDKLILPSVNININASDNVGIVRVELYVDGKYIANDTIAPYSFAWNIRRVLAGSHIITARAYDAAGNKSISEAINVIIK